MKTVFLNRKSRGVGALILLCMTLSLIACNGTHGKETPTLTPTVAPAPMPEGWWARLIKQGRTDVSRDLTEPSETEGYLKEPVSVSKTVRLGDFEFVMMIPKSIYRLENLQNGTDIVETTLILRYVGENDSVTISAGDLPFSGLMITDTSENWEGGGAYDIECHHVLEKGEEISFTKLFKEYSKEVTAAGYGMIAGIVEFSVLDENGEDTEEYYQYLLSVPFDLLE